MKNTYVWLLALMLILNISYLGFIGPFLISFKDDGLVVLGFVLGVFLAVFDFYYVKKLFIKETK